MSDINEMKPAKKGPSPVVVVLIGVILAAIANAIYRSTDNYLYAFGFFALGLVGTTLWIKAARKPGR